MDAIIAGAVFDFAARLSTLERPIIVGASHECAPVLIEQMKAWAKERGLNIEEVDHEWTDNRELGVLPGDVQVGRKVRELVSLLTDATEGRR